MTLTDFLLTADADNQIALDAAKLHPLTTGALIHRDSMNSFLAMVNIYVRFKEIALDSTNPFQNLISAFLDSTEYSFKVGTTTGDTQIAALDKIIAAGIDISAPLATIRPVILARANQVTYPLADKTLNDVLAIRQPAVWTACNHGGELHTISASAKDTLGFSASLVEASDNISIRCTWATAVGAQEFVSQRKLTMSADSLYVSQSFSRASLGLPSEARVLKFEYLAAYDGVVTSLSVSK
jgi:hypothetical protein